MNFQRQKISSPVVISLVAFFLHFRLTWPSEHVTCWNGWTLNLSFRGWESQLVEETVIKLPSANLHVRCREKWLLFDVTKYVRKGVESSPHLFLSVFLNKTCAKLEEKKQPEQTQQNKARNIGYLKSKVTFYEIANRKGATFTSPKWSKDKLWSICRFHYTHP